MRFLTRFFWPSRFAIPRMNWDALVLVMIKIVTQTKFVRLVAETGQNCVTEIDGDGFRVAFIYAVSNEFALSRIYCLNDESL